MAIPTLRVALRNSTPPRPERDYVLYWMISARRTRWNFALEHAVEAAVRLGKRLVVLEALRCDYRWASDRLHQFVLDGMADNGARFASAAVAYFPYVEPQPNAGKGLLLALARQACLVVADEFPCFFLPRMVEAAAKTLDVRLETVDGNGLLPLCDAEQAFPTAYAFRRHLQKKLPGHLQEFPESDPLAAPDLLRDPTLPAIAAGWRSAPFAPETLAIDHGVAPVTGLRGGERAGTTALETFVDRKLNRYNEDRNQPELVATSGLSPYLHFGHVSVHQILMAVASREGWTPANLGTSTAGKRAGWWCMSPSA